LKLLKTKTTITFIIFSSLFLFFFTEEANNSSDVGNSPLIGSSKRAQTPPEPIAAAVSTNVTPTATKSKSPAVTPGSQTSDPWPSQSDEDIDRLVAMHTHRHSSLSSLGVSIK
jgi:hypothetical protein